MKKTTKKKDGTWDIKLPEHFNHMVIDGECECGADLTPPTKRRSKTEKEAATHFYNALKDDPEAIIEWCEKEVRAYQSLIKLVKGGQKRKREVN